MDEILEAEPVTPKATTEVFVVMKRYSNDFWSAFTTSKTLEDAQRSAGIDATCQAWKIVKVSGLPIDVPAGEA